LPQEDLRCARREHLAKSTFAYNDKGFAEGHSSQCRPSLANRNIGCGVRRTRIVHFSREQYDLAISSFIDRCSASGNILSRSAVADDHKSYLVPSEGQTANRVASREESFQLKLGDQPTDHRNHNLVRLDVEAKSKTSSIDRRAIAFDIDWWL
jgi:hypothetical protein